MGGWKINRNRKEEGGKESNAVSKWMQEGKKTRWRIHLHTPASLRVGDLGQEVPPLAPSDDNTSVEARCDWNVQIKKHVCFSRRMSMSICYREAPLFISVSRDLSPATACRATSHPQASRLHGTPPLMQNYFFMHLFVHSPFPPSWANVTRGIPARFVGRVFCRQTRARMPHCLTGERKTTRRC